MPEGTCSIEGCGRPLNYRGWCSPHYTRWLRHGDPLAGRTLEGEPLRWLRSMISETSATGDTACRTDWPFQRSDNGYPKMWWNGGSCPAQRVVLELDKRPPPAPGMVSRHICGNGASGCLNPRHLEWGTAKQNTADRLLHGTDARGAKSSSVKLTEAEVRAIRASPLNQRALARQYGVSPTAIFDVIRRRSWVWLE